MTYVQHGRRHAPNGTDPIPGSSALAYATLKNFGAITVPGDNAWHYLDLIGGSSAVFDTSDTDLFSNPADAFFTGTPSGLGIAQPGLYEVKVNATASGGTNGAILEVYHDDENAGSGTLSAFQSGRVSLLIGDTWDVNATNHLFFTERFAYLTAADMPAVIVLKAKLHSGSDITLNVQLLADQISQRGTDAI